MPDMSTRRLALSTFQALGFLRALPARLLALAALSRSRKGLMRLDDHQLRDIGLSREDAQAEARRPVWDAPSHWKG
jgi:uncharacterized protein YjiS (DUF1127 family)